MNRKNLIIHVILLLSACKAGNMQTIGTIEKTDKGLEAIINADARVEIIADGFDVVRRPALDTGAANAAFLRYSTE